MGQENGTEPEAASMSKDDEVASINSNSMLLLSLCDGVASCIKARHSFSFAIISSLRSATEERRDYSLLSARVVRPISEE